MNKKAHTPLPFGAGLFVGKASKNSVQIRQLGFNKELVAKVLVHTILGLGDDYKQRQAKANAEYIVMACNEHEQLKQDRAELVASVWDAFNYIDTGSVPDKNILTDDDLHSELQKVLKKLGEL